MDSGATWVAFHPKSFDHIEECQRQLDRYRFDVERLAAKINAIAARQRAFGLQQQLRGSWAAERGRAERIVSPTR